VGLLGAHHILHVGGLRVNISPFSVLLAKNHKFAIVNIRIVNNYESVFLVNKKIASLHIQHKVTGPENLPLN